MVVVVVVDMQVQWWLALREALVSMVVGEEVAVDLALPLMLNQ
jgi:hypothetical protein